ncbi:MAG TPA: lipase maturation factor family protein [Kiritimatiellia bacterium]|nr:lipase maturation factor family protein [Kiritimatiellia bacterium]HMP35149.1 lipase maturation factor family protein [Kiritimatiellia bacterium]
MTGRPRTTYRYAADLFPRALGLVYLIALYSLLPQLPGLIGENGILPVTRFLDAVHGQLGERAVWQLPSLLWLGSSDRALAMVCWIGMIAAGFMVLGIVPFLSALIAWLAYLSITTGGQVFLGFQWDNLLLESGFLAILLAPMVVRVRVTDPPVPNRFVVFLLHWLLFRLMFASGYVKWASGDPSWRDLSALQYHFWTQPLPIWTAWFAHHAPGWLLKSGTAIMFVIELAVPWLIFAGRWPRLVAFLSFTLLQIGIALTGNYGYFNGLSFVLGLLLLDDRLWPFRRLEAEPEMPSLRSRVLVGMIRWPLAFAVFLVSVVTFIPLFKRGVQPPAPLAELVRVVAPFRSVNQYGLFAAMTKTRPEIVIEGSRDGKSWQAYEFPWKPGDIYRTPVIVAPHMPRLDWQMWFAALGSYQGNPWFMNLLVRLLEGQPDVLALLEHNPFPGEPPSFIRAVLYEYTFSTPDQYKADYRWWDRSLKGLYCPILSRTP